MADVYRDDLAYIHDTGHGDFARQAAPALLKRLEQHGLHHGLVIDLGCGSGIWAAALVAAGYDVLGTDFSASMIALARQRVPHGHFRVESYLTADLPSCVAVTALGECFNYLFDRGNTGAGLGRLFRRVHDALCVGGLFIFDVAVPGRVPGSGVRQHYREGPDWAVLVDAKEDRKRLRLTRRITSFRKVGELYRRDQEVHEQRLFKRAELAAQLRRVGFRVRTIPGYGRTPFARGLVGFLARKVQVSR
jgi:SAM-dependent methyltransferase